MECWKVPTRSLTQPLCLMMWELRHRVANKVIVGDRSRAGVAARVSRHLVQGLQEHMAMESSAKA